MKKTHISSNLEHQIQTSFVDWCKLARHEYPHLDRIFAIPNESYGGTESHARRGARLKAEGRRAGVPDLFLPVPWPWPEMGSGSRFYFGLFLETKRPGKAPRPNQRDWIDFLSGRGYACTVYHSVDEGRDVINQYYKGTLKSHENRR